VFKGSNVLSLALTTVSSYLYTGSQNCLQNHTSCNLHARMLMHLSGWERGVVGGGADGTSSAGGAGVPGGGVDGSLAIEDDGRPCSPFSHKFPGCGADGKRLLYPLCFFCINKQRHEDVELAVSRFFKRHGYPAFGRPFDEIKVTVDGGKSLLLLVQPECFMETGDICYLNLEIGVAELGLQPNLDLLAPAAPRELVEMGRKRRASDIKRIFEQPHPTVQPTPLAQPSDAILERVKLYTNEALASWEHDPRTGLVSAFMTVSGHCLRPFNLPEPDRDDFFTSRWRELPMTMAQDLSAHAISYTHKVSSLERVDYSLVMESMTTNALTAIQAGCGTGKTHAVIEAIKKLPQNLTILYLSTRIAVADGLLPRLESLGFVSYLNFKKGEVVRGARVIISYDSLHRLDANFQYSVVVLDELPEIWKQTMARTVRDPALAFELLCKRIRVATRVLAMSHDLRGHHVRWVIQARGGHDDNVGLIQLEPKGSMGDVTPFATHWECERYLFYLARLGKRVVVHTSSRKHAESLQRRFTDLRLPVITLTSKSNKELPKQILAKESILASYQVFIYTSKLGSGASVDIPQHFDCVFQFTNSSHDLNIMKQALFRVRDIKQREYFVFVDSARGAAKNQAEVESQMALNYEASALVRPNLVPVNPLRADIFTHQVVEHSQNKATFPESYTAHLQHDVHMNLVELPGNFLECGRALASEAQRHRNDARSDDLKRRWENVRAKDEPGEAAEKFDLADPRFKRHLNNLMTFANGSEEALPLSVHLSLGMDIKVHFALVRRLSPMLSLKPDFIFSGEGITFHNKIKLGSEDSLWLSANLCMLGYNPVNDKCETRLLGKHGNESCFFGQAPEFNRDAPFKDQVWPAAAARYALHHSLIALFGFGLQEVNLAKNVRVFPDAEIEHVLADESVAEFKTRCKAVAKGRTMKELLNVYTLRIAHSDYRNRMMQLASATFTRRGNADLALKLHVAPINESVVYAAEHEKIKRAKVRCEKELEKVELVFGAKETC
jgi:hypothetical protein